MKTRKGPFGCVGLFAFGLTALLGIGAPVAQAADPCPNAQFRVGASANLPDCRAYEQVTPVDKNGADIVVKTGPPSGEQLAGPREALFPPVHLVLAGAKGGRVAFAAPTGIGDTQSAPFISQYVATRGDGGWAGVSVNPPFEQTQPGVSFRIPTFQAFSRNLDRAIFRIGSTGSSLAPNDFPLENEFISNYYVRDSTGALTTLVPETGALNISPSDVNEEATSVIVRTEFGFGLFQSYIDENGVGQSRQVSLDESDQPLFANPGGQVNLFDAFSSLIYTDGQLTEGAQSQDGDRFLFNDGMGECRDEAAFAYIFYAFDCDNGNVYVRDMELGETRRINAPDPGVVDPDPGPGTLAWGGSKDLSRVFFTSQEKLTADATAGWDPEACESTGGTGDCYTTVGSFGDLYRYDWDGNGGAGKLEDITVDPGGSDGAEVLGVLGFSDDGDRAYFVARSNRLDGTQGVDGEANLYSWSYNDGAPETTFVATLEPMQPDPTGMSCCASDYPYLGDVPNWGMSTYERSSKVTRDGKHLVFVSKGRLDPGFDNDGYAQVYVYDAVEDELRCASCFGQEPPRHDSYLTAGEMIDRKMQHKRVQSISEDGRFAFFNSGESLSKRDSNGRTDAYRFDSETDSVALISDGTNGGDSYFVDADESGHDAFFTTRGRLTPPDTDDDVDVYVARVGGGFAYKSPPPGCEGDACQPPPTLPRETTPGSAGFAGPGSRAPRRAKPKARKCGKNQRRARRAGRVRCVKKKAVTKKRRRTGKRRQTGKGRSGK